MKRNTFFILMLIVLFLNACGDKKEDKTTNGTTDKNTENNTGNDSKPDKVKTDVKNADAEDIKKTLNEIAVIFKKQDAKELKKYFYFQDKYMLVSNPGVYIIAAVSDKFDFAEHLNFKTDELKFEEWAEFDIDTQEWNKQGIFAEVNIPNDYFTSICQNMKDYIGEVDDKTVELAGEIDKMEFIRVVFTEQYFRFYFAKKGDKWLIVAIDIHDFSA